MKEEAVHGSGEPWSVWAERLRQEGGAASHAGTGPPVLFLPGLETGHPSHAETDAV